MDHSRLEADLEAIQTRAEFGSALERLRQDRRLTYRIMQEHAKKRHPRGSLPNSTLSNTFRGVALPSEDTLLAILDALAVEPSLHGKWLRTRRRVQEMARSLERRAGIRVIDADMQQMGVHPAVGDSRGHSDQPIYVPRDQDHLLDHIIRSADDRGRFALLVGGSCAGKTRMAFEAALRVLPSWSLFVPASVDDLAESLESIQSQTVIWLDEIDRFIVEGLDIRSVRQLLAKREVVIMGTLWPSYYHQWSQVSHDEPATPSNRRERAILSMAQVIPIDASLSEAERLRVNRAGRHDARFRDALQSEYGFTQSIAAAPALVERWVAAEDTFARFVITAAIDLRLISGIRLISEDMLRSAISDYVSTAEWSTAPADWFERAIDYGTAKLKGAASALVLHRQSTGNLISVADYLQQYGVDKSSSPVPRSCWNALIKHCDDPDILYSASYAARKRALRGIAKHLLVHALEYRSDPKFEYDLFRILIRAGDVEEAIKARDRLFALGPSDPLRRLLGEAITDAHEKEPGILFEQVETFGGSKKSVEFTIKMSGSAAPEHEPGPVELDMDQRQAILQVTYSLLGKMAEEGDKDALLIMAQRLLDDDSIKQQIVQRAIEAGLPGAMIIRSQMLASRGEEAEARRWMLLAAEAGDSDAQYEVAKYALERGDDQQAEKFLDLSLRASNISALFPLADLMERLGKLDKLEMRLTPLVEDGFPCAWRRLVGLLLSRGKKEHAWKIVNDVGLGAYQDVPFLAYDLRARGLDGDANEIEQSSDLLLKYARHGDPSAVRAVYHYLLADGRSEEEQRLGEVWLREALKTGGSPTVRDYMALLKKCGHSNHDIEVWFRSAVLQGVSGALGELMKFLLNKPDVDDAIALITVGLKTTGETAEYLAGD